MSQHDDEIVEGKTTVDGDYPHYHTFVYMDNVGMTVETISVDKKKPSEPHIHAIEVNLNIQPAQKDNHIHKVTLENNSSGILKSLFKKVFGRKK